MTWTHATLEGIRHDLCRVADENDWEKYHTPRNLLLAVQKEVGDLAEAFQWRQDATAGLKGWTPAERRHVEEELSDVLAYTVRLADRCGVDLARAVTERLNRGGSSAGTATAGSPKPAASAPQKHQDPVGPTTRTASPPSKAGMKRSVRGERPEPLDAKKLEKVSNEHSIANKRPAFKRTLSVVCDMQDPTKLYSPTHFQHDLFSPVTEQKNFDVEYNTPQPVLPTSLSKSSLTLTAGDAGNTAGNATRPAPAEPTSPLSPKSLMDFFNMVEKLDDLSDEDLRSAEITFCAPLGDQILPLVEGGRHIMVTKSTLADFVRLARELQVHGTAFVAPKDHTGSGAPGAVAPAAPAMVPSALRPKNTANGDTIAVTPPEDKRPKQPQAAQKPKRRNIKRTLSVQLPNQRWDPDEVQQHFSPTHFDHDLFSPSTTKTDFEVTYSKEGGIATLPLSLSKNNLHTIPKSQAKSAKPAQENGVAPRSPGKRLTPVHSMRRPSVASFGSDDEEEYKGLDLLCEVAEERGKKSSSPDAENSNGNSNAANEDAPIPLSPRAMDLDKDFLPIISEIEVMLEKGELNEQDLVDMELTFCIPSGGKVYDLIENGRTTRVTMQRLPEFIKLAKSKRRDIEASER